MAVYSEKRTKPCYGAELLIVTQVVRVVSTGM
jgi:hypothetical protein